MRSGLVTGLLLIGAGFAANAESAAMTQCTRTLEEDAIAEFSHFDARSSSSSGRELWDRFVGFVDRFGPCDDGSIAESFADATVELLTHHWGDALRTPSLLKRSRVRRFVVDHITIAASVSETRRLRTNALTRCPARAASFCREIVSACDRLQKEADAAKR